MRKLTKNEQAIYIENRDQLHEHLSELQADLEDMSDAELIDCRSTLLERVNWCLTAILETDEDNIDLMNGTSNGVFAEVYTINEKG